MVLVKLTRSIACLCWLKFFGIASFISPAFGQFASVRVQIVDVGQGDGILNRTPNQLWIVIDAGTNRRMADAMRGDWNVDRIALAIVSHRHFDHLGGMDSVLHDLTVEKFLGVIDDCPGNKSEPFPLVRPE